MFIIMGTVVFLLGLVKRKVWVAVLGLFLALWQFAWPPLYNANVKRTILERREAVQNMKTRALPAHYPRLLIIEGDTSPSYPAWFIASGYFDQIDLHGERLVAAGDPVTCRKIAKGIANPSGPLEWQSSDGNPRLLVKNCVRIVGPAVATKDAVILRVGNKTTLYEREAAGRHGAPRAVQLTWRQNGREMLIHYDEMPNLPHPKSVTEIFTSSYDYPCSDFAYLQIVANYADAAKQPDKAESMLRRTGGKQSRYGDCVVSPPPDFETAESSDD